MSQLLSITAATKTKQEKIHVKHKFAVNDFGEVAVIVFKLSRLNIITLSQVEHHNSAGLEYKRCNVYISVPSHLSTTT